MVEGWLEHFRGCFEDRISFVRQTCLIGEKPRPEGLLLLTGLLDALAGYRYYEVAGNYTRFRALLLEHSGERDFWSKVSVYRLYEELRQSNDEGLREIAEGVFEKYVLLNFLADPVRYNPDGPIADVVSDFEEVRRFAEKCEYTAILWSYRNYAMHEGTALNVPPPCPFGSDYEPIQPYYSVSSLSSENRMVRFMIPTQYVLKTLETCVESFMMDCKQDRFDFDKMMEFKINQRPFTSV
jgi:hypothetical protein